MAAILAADVVGYCRLIGEDEERTLATLKTYRGVFDGLIARREGRVFGRGWRVLRKREGFWFPILCTTKCKASCYFALTTSGSARSKILRGRSAFFGSVGKEDN